MILMYIYNEILYILVDWYCSKYSVMGIYMIPHTLEYWATIAHDHNHDHVMMSYINSWLCYENPQDSSYTTSFLKRKRKEKEKEFRKSELFRGLAVTGRD